MDTRLYDLVVSHCRLRSGGPVLNVGIAQGLIQTVSDEEINGSEIVEAEGNLLSPGFVNAHTHLDKARLLSQMSREMYGNSLEHNRTLLRRLKQTYSKDDVITRAKETGHSMIRNGVTAIRTQVDVDPTAELVPMRALLELKQALAPHVTLQVSAFPQEGVLTQRHRDLLEESLRMGADILGGNPIVETSQENQRAHIDFLFELAQQYDVDLDIQIDESTDPRNFLLPYLAQKTIEQGYHGRVTATHCISLALVDDGDAKRTIERLAEGRVRVIVTPSCNLITQFHPLSEVYRRPTNSITRVKELMAAGVPVALGTDNIQDIFYPLGNGSLLRELHVLVTTTRMTGTADIASYESLISLNGAAILGLDYGVAPGKRADMVLLAGETILEALQGPDYVRCTIAGGRVLAVNRLESSMSLQVGSAD